MKKVLITGGCGFIGSHFIRGFLNHSPDTSVINLDLLTYAGNPKNNQDYEKDPRYQFVKGDIRDSALVEKIMPEVQAVINFAAETHVDRSIDNAQDFLTTNILGLKVLLDSAMRNKIQRFLHISTDEVYGSLLEGSADENALITPNSPYSAAKASADLLARSYWKTYQFPVIIARSSNNYGPNQFPEKVIPLFVTNLIEGKKVPLYGKGENIREWIYVEDNCEALRIVFEKGKPGEIYNIGSGHELSNKALTHQILGAMGVGEDKIEFVQDRPGHDFRYSIKTDKIRSLGFHPKWTFEKGLQSTVEWYRANASWWMPLKRDKFTLK